MSILRLTDQRGRPYEVDAAQVVATSTAIFESMDGKNRFRTTLTLDDGTVVAVREEKHVVDGWLAEARGNQVEGKPREEFLALAEQCGARVTGKPDGSEPIEIVFSVQAWRKFDSSVASSIDGRVPTDEALRARVRDAVIEALGGAYDCTRVWSAWGVGTMGPDDFSLVAEDDDRVNEIVDAVMTAVKGG